MEESQGQEFSASPKKAKVSPLFNVEGADYSYSDSRTPAECSSTSTAINILTCLINHSDYKRKKEIMK